MDNMSYCCKPHDSVDATTPIYTIGVVANLLDIHPKILRSYEAEGLVCPKYIGCYRLFSYSDITLIKCLISMPCRVGVGLSSIKRLLEIACCLNIAGRHKVFRDYCKSKSWNNEELLEAKIKNDNNRLIKHCLSIISVN